MAKPILKKHAAGEAVQELTRLLVERGHLTEVTDTFDLTVHHAVVEFQSRHIDERGRPLVGAPYMVGP